MGRLFLCTIFISFNTWGLIYAQPMIIGHKTVIQSEILQEEREIVIYTPKDYVHSQEKYPILYLLDAEWNFHYVSGIVKQLASSGDIPKMIVVGIINTNRSRDLTPAGKQDNPQRFGGAKPFLDFLSEEVQAFMDDKFRVQPFRILAGHSFGGLFSIYSMLEKPDFFQAYIALSPSLGRNNEQQVRIAQQFFQEKNTLPRKLYLAVANEGGFTYLSTQKLLHILEEQVEQEVFWKFTHFKQENHASITIQGFLEGLTFIFEGFNPEKMPELDDIFLIEAHFKQLSERLGYALPVPEYYYQKFVQEQLAQRELDYAFFILHKYQAKYPNSSEMLFSMADAHLLNGNFEEAKKYYEKLKKLQPDNEQIDTLLKKIPE